MTLSAKRPLFKIKCGKRFTNGRSKRKPKIAEENLKSATFLHFKFHNK